MRRCLKILRWMGMSLSALLLVLTVVLWIASSRTVLQLNVTRWREYEDVAAWGKDWEISAQSGRFLMRERYTLAQQPPAEWPGQAANDPEMKLTSHVHWSTGTVRDNEPCNIRRVCPLWVGGPDDPEFPKPIWHLGLRFGGLEGCGFGTILVVVPCGWMAILFGLWPGLFVARRLLRRTRYGPGMCPNCGYDLRATPDRCPECGREVVGGRQGDNEGRQGDTVTRGQGEDSAREVIGGGR